MEYNRVVSHIRVGILSFFTKEAHMVGMNTGLEGIRRRHDTARFTAHTLSNGITVWLQEPTFVPSDEGLLFAVLSGVGARLDPFDRSGVAHYMEHVLFRGTEKWSSRELLMASVAALGGTVDVANTTSDRTIYAAFLPKEHLSAACEVLLEIIRHPLLRCEDVTLERGAILGELERKQSHGDLVSLWRAMGALYGTHPLGTNTLGTSDSISSITLPDLAAFHERYYHAGNLQFLCGGSFAERRDAIEELEKWFGSVPGGEEARIQEDGIPFGKVGRTIVCDPRAGRDSMHLLWLLPPLTPEQTTTMRELGHILSHGMDSPLFRELRTNRGLVYEHDLLRVRTSHDASIIQFVCPTKRQNFAEAEAVFCDVLRALKSEDIVQGHSEVQLRRKRSFTTPKDACYEHATPDAIDDLMAFGHPISHHEREEISDSLTFDEMFAWRDFLLTTRPFVVEVLKD